MNKVMIMWGLRRVSTLLAVFIAAHGIPGMTAPVVQWGLVALFTVGGIGVSIYNAFKASHDSIKVFAKELFMDIIQHGTTGVAAFLVSKGIVSNDQVTTLSSLLPAIMTVMHELKNQQAIDTSKLPIVTAIVAGTPITIAPSK